MEERRELTAITYGKEHYISAKKKSLNSIGYILVSSNRHYEIC